MFVVLFSGERRKRVWSLLLLRGSCRWSDSTDQGCPPTTTLRKPCRSVPGLPTTRIMISRGQRPFSSTRALRVFWHFLPKIKYWVTLRWPLGHCHMCTGDPYNMAKWVLVTLDQPLERNHEYSRVPIRRGVRNKRSGTQDEKCIGRNISHMCLGLYSRCRFIVTNLHLKVLHFNLLIQLQGMAHYLEIVLDQIKALCRINVQCLLE